MGWRFDNGGWLSVGLVLAGCASIPEAPAPVEVSTEPDVVSRSATAVPYVAPDRPSRHPPAPLPALPLDIRLSPSRPTQASVVSIRIGEPPGPPLEDAVATLAGFDVGLVRRERGWIGVAALPLDSAGVFTLELTGTRNGSTVVERRTVWVSARVYPETRIGIPAREASDPEMDARIARERALIESRLMSSSANWWPDDTFAWPRPAVRTSPFGERRMFNGSVRSRHMGLDLRGRRGQPVYAAAAGRVVLTGRFVYQGNAVYVDHGLGVVTAYFHFSSIDVEEGEVVEAGQRLGRVGSTGRSTAPHLHWSAYVNGESVDPESLIGFRLFPKDSAADDDEVDRETRNH
ncbi:MAG: M23 family metallopeptidase [Gemmatimonadota bacterium]